MLVILKYFWQMCLLKAGPDKIPAQPRLLAAVLVLYGVTEILAALLTRTQESFELALRIIPVEITMLGLVTYLLLWFLKLPTRFLPTYTAIVGCDTVVFTIQLPLLLIMQITDIPTLILFLNTAWFVCFCWLLVIIGHIYHRAANVSIVQGGAIAVVAFALTLTTIYSFIPME
jgi:hypothetical protein|tara:strand:+ start:899 stop:1417 length:519 start_codon:yes stop_codon:yes gene_type:complete